MLKEILDLTPSLSQGEGERMLPPLFHDQADYERWLKEKPTTFPSLKGGKNNPSFPSGEERGEAHYLSRLGLHTQANGHQ
ncbi:MAG: hypothetical protein IJS82_01605 [Paludibacteraceae bacterium]|nr:hypothetical protein [Paludibacteraceae bacterium]